MSLETYRRKRNFSRTPEPAGVGDGAVGAAPPQTGRRFVVQRHRATALHYDFRLEMDGVLVSWAVPRGPSLKPLERRMAMHVEDHPVEYFDFEGVIPKGSYGAGDVIVWDWGTWEPEETDDPGREIRKGELKFRLYGQKLRGRFVIVRTRTDQGGRDAWLLIHKKDEDADEKWDVDALPRSVKSGRTNDEVKAGMPALWLSGAPAGEAEVDLAAARSQRQPEFIPPMLATLADRPFSSPDWLFELKLDGYRIEAVVSVGAVKLFTRNKQDGARYFPHLAKAKPTWINAKEAIVDGEVVALNAAGLPDFSLLQDLAGMKGLAMHRGERRGTSVEEAAAWGDGGGEEPVGPGGPDPRSREAHGALVYHAFDLLHYEGKSLLDVPLEERKKLLKTVIRDHPQVVYLSHVIEDGEHFYEAAKQQRLEGIMAKLRRSTYEPGRRSKAWLKVKIRAEQELVVIGYEPGKGTHTDLGALQVAVHDGGELRYAGEVGSGIDTRQRAAFRAQLDALHRDTPPAVGVPRLGMSLVRWSDPKLVIRAEFTEWTSDGLLRQAAFKGVEPGKSWKHVVRERPVETDEAVEAAEEEASAEEVRPGPNSRTLRSSLPPKKVGDGGDGEDPPQGGRPGSRRRLPDRRRAQPARPPGTSRGDPGQDPAVEPAEVKSSPPGARRRSVAAGSRPSGGSQRLLRAAGEVGDPAEAATAEEIAALDAMTRDGMWRIGGHELNLTNLDKVLFPEAGYTKRDLIRYYVTIAPVLLPHLRDRPLNVDRWPDGVTGPHFWQKQIPTHAPRWVSRWDYPEAGKDESHTYVICDRVATLAWLANQACIDLHPWTSRLPEWYLPTFALIDIDPGTKTTFDQVLVLARLYRRALEHLGLTAFPKVTGKRGIQIWVPVEQKYTFEQTREWVAELSRAVGATAPELISWEWDKARRSGRARLDFTQNAINKTLVAPYAVRPVPAAGVSVPIHWDELEDGSLRADRWDLKSAVARVEAVGDLFRGAEELEQQLPGL